MPTKFNISRLSIFIVVFLWTIICLAIAGHFQSLLVSSDLTHFIPFALFVCSASALILLVLLGCTLRRERNPISTRIELGCLGFLGVLWLALGAFLITSDSSDADVECYSSTDDTDPVDVSGFSTETYQAQYRVLEAFSLFNVILVWSFFLFLLGLTLRHHLRGNRKVWRTPVNIYPWFAPRSSPQSKQLPAPVTSRSRSRGRSHGVSDARAYAEKNAKYTGGDKYTGEKPAKYNGDKGAARTYQYPTQRGTATYVVWTPQGHTVPVRAHTRETRDKYKRDASPRR